MNVLGIRKSSSPNDDENVLTFTVFLSDEDAFYKAFFSFSKINGSMLKADLFKSISIDSNPAIKKVFFFPEHHLAKNPNWPDFYFFATTTRERTQKEQQNG